MKQLVPPYRTQHVAANEAALRAGADAGPAARHRPGPSAEAAAR